MTAVVDTNVLVSGLISVNSYPARVVDLVRSGRLRAVVDDRILAEYSDVLRRDFLRAYITLDEAEDIIEFLRHDSQVVVGTIVIESLPDAGDMPFLEAALAAESPLITGNLRHFPPSSTHGCRVLTPKEFVERNIARERLAGA